MKRRPNKVIYHIEDISTNCGTTLEIEFKHYLLFEFSNTLINEGQLKKLEVLLKVKANMLWMENKRCKKVDVKLYYGTDIPSRGAKIYYVKVGDEIALKITQVYYDFTHENAGAEMGDTYGYLQ